MVSYSMVILYILGIMGVWVFLTKILSPQNQLHKSTILNACNTADCYKILKLFIQWNFLLPACLCACGVPACPPACLSVCLPDTFRLIMAKATGLVFCSMSLQFDGWGAFWYIIICTVHEPWTYLCPPLCPISFC